MTVEQKAHSYASSHEIDVPQLFHYLYNAFLAGASSVEAKDFLEVLEENYQAQIAGFFNYDKTDEEKAKRNAVIEEYKDLIGIYKFGNWMKPSSSVEVGGIDKMQLESFNRGFVEYFRQHNYRDMYGLWENIYRALSECPSSSEPVPLTIDDLEYVLSEFICTYAPHHSQIESPRMFVNRSLANRAKNPKNVEAVGDDAIAFAEWAAKNDWFYDIDDKDWFNGEGEDQIVMTSGKLYELFKQRK